jgi:hypothetical protein
MPLLSENGFGFSQSVKARGREYFRDGVVTITRSSPDEIVARIDGSEKHAVRIELSPSGRAARWSCDCSVAKETGECAHIWAAVLQVDSEGIFNRRGDDRDVRIADRVDARALAVPVWRKPLAQLRKQSPQFGKTLHAGLGYSSFLRQGRRIVYIIDAPASSQGKGLVLEIGLQKRSGEGAWHAPKSFTQDHQQLLSAPDESDRIIAQMLMGSQQGGFHQNDSGARRYLLTSRSLALILPRICQTGRCRVRRAPGQENFEPVQWDDDGAWEFQLDLSLSAGEKFVMLTGCLRRKEQTVSLNEPALMLADGIVALGSNLARLEHFGAWPLLQYFREHHRIKAPVDELDDLVQELAAHSHLPRLRIEPGLQVGQPEIPPHFRLTLTRPNRPSEGEAVLEAALSVDYDGIVVTEAASTGAIFDRSRRLIVRRDRRVEADAINHLLALGAKMQWSYDAGRHVPTLKPAQVSRVAMELIAQGWHIEAEGAVYRRPGKMRVKVNASGIDWFEVDGGIEFDGVVAAFPQLLAAARRGERMITLDDGSVGLVPAQWVAKYASLAGMGQEQGDTLRFSRAQAGFLDLLLASVPDAQFDESFQSAREQIAAFEKIQPADAPDGFVGALRDYQKDGVGWLQFLQAFGFGGCLADDMGLGKTIQVLALLEQRRQANAGPSLVVVPRSLVFNWISEAGRFTPGLRILDHSGTGRARPSDHFADYDLILTTYGTLRRDAIYFKDVTFDYVILDEAQAIKNAGTNSAKAARLLHGRHKLALTGTPVENRLSELWSIFEFLNPGMLGSASVFKALNTAETGPAGRQMLAKALRPFILRRTKSEVAGDLPEKLEQTIYCDLDESQRKLYDELREHYRQSLLGRIDELGMSKSKMHVLEALLRLRQAACHPGLIDGARSNEPSAKLDEVLYRIEEVAAEGHKALVFSQFTSLLALLRKRLDASKTAYEYLDGKTRDRQLRVNRFQNDPDCLLFLISLKAGGVGLNLTAADYVFLLDPWWNPAVEAQAIDRTHRIGQTRKVFAYRLIARDTVEEKVLQLQESKRALADAIITADNSLISSMKREDLELLLS